MMSEFDFFKPEQGLWAILGLFFWLIDYFGVFKKAELVIPPKYNDSIKRLSLKRIPLLLVAILAWSVIGVSLMGPRKPIGKSSAQKEINDIYFVVDVSRSMLAEDFPPNRLEAAKLRIKEFVKLSPVDRIGIVMFADKVFTLIPATTDLSLVSQSVDQIRIGFLGSGTNIGDALGLAIARASSSIAENKSIVLLTDGASNVGLLSPDESAKKAKELNIKIHTIGIGGDPRAKLPSGRDIFGRKRYSKIPGGSMDFKALEEISSISGGQSFVAGDDRSLKNILAEINKLERKKLDVAGRVIYKEFYWNFLLVGFILLSLVEISRRLLIREAY